MVDRTLSRYLLRDAGYYPIVTLTGPRQSGKTTLVRATFPQYAYVSLEERELRAFAREDPRGFLSRYPPPLIIDEAQRVPDLFSYLQTAVDLRKTTAQYILTGSQNSLLMESVSQSLAGRAAVLHLLPFTRRELERQSSQEPTGPASLFDNRQSSRPVWETIRSGLYPRIHDRGIPPEIWYPDYVRTYVERDVRTLTNIGELERFERFLSLAAGRSGQILSYSSLATNAGVSVDTARRWISVLRTSFVLFLLQPHHRNFNKRITRSPKLYFYDTGLLCHLLGIRTTDQLVDHPLRGPIFETYVVSEVAKTYHHHRRSPPVFFWRDRTGHEVDLLIDEAGELYPVEIKSGATINSEMTRGVRWWCGEAGVPLSHGSVPSGRSPGRIRRCWINTSCVLTTIPAPMSVIPGSGAVCPATVTYGARMWMSADRSITPPTSKITVRGPDASSSASRNEPATVAVPNPSAPGNTGTSPLRSRVASKGSTFGGTIQQPMSAGSSATDSTAQRARGDSRISVWLHMMWSVAPAAGRRYDSRAGVSTISAAVFG